jgi:hypothetical protein
MHRAPVKSSALYREYSAISDAGILHFTLSHDVAVSLLTNLFKLLHVAFIFVQYSLSFVLL